MNGLTRNSVEFHLHFLWVQSFLFITQWKDMLFCCQFESVLQKVCVIYVFKAKCLLLVADQHSHVPSLNSYPAFTYMCSVASFSYYIN